MDLKAKNIVIDFEPISRRVFVTSDNTIYELLSDLSVPIRSICGGKGTCGKCRILIQNGNEFLNPITNIEKKFLSQSDLEENWRLACQTRINKKKLQIPEKRERVQLRIFLPNELILEDFKILTTGVSKGIDLKPTVKKYYLDVKKPSLDNQLPDFERIIAALFSIEEKLNNNIQINIDFKLLAILPKLLRDNDNKITITLWNNKTIIACEPGNTVKDCFGIALDIGTTTIVGYLMNLNNGKVYALDSCLNSQTAYGEDLITRLTFIKDGIDNLNLLNSTVINDINKIILNACENINIEPSQIYEASIVGNSVMHHIFLGIDPVNIGLSPFVPVIQKGLNVKAKDVDLKISKTGNVYVAPVISGFVGADTIGVILSSKIYEEKDLTLAIDIGTNGEIIIGNKNFLTVGSCAAGSALEGAHISNGMRAAAGAIDTIKIVPDTIDVSFSTIKNKKPIGICGSGLVDAIAEMLKSKILTRSGNFNKEFINNERFIKKEKNIEFIIAKKDETSIKTDITISQYDVRQLQMAKAAFYSGMRIILNQLNDAPEIQQVFLAGAFGNYINANNAKFIGMIPDIPENNIYQIGNAAGIGAQYCLINKDLRLKADQLLKEIQYTEIAVIKEFQKEYAEAMYFPHLNLDYFPNLKEYDKIQKR
ncbi:MAG: ASKHA domain-containing protein [Candidatus Thorarchaeota archaeon]